jgi:hypothetical protein
MASRPSVGRWVLLSLLLVGLASVSCASWRRQWIGPALVVERDHPTVLRVAQVDGTRVIINEPTIVGDSLIGAPANVSRRTSLALHDIEYVEARRSRSTPGILLLGLVLPIALGIAVAATWD